MIRTVVLTETATGIGILLLLALPLNACLLLLPPLGIALNGTSSVLYGSVADLVSSDRRARSYALFYTVGISASALSPSCTACSATGAGCPCTLATIGVHRLHHPAADPRPSHAAHRHQPRSSRARLPEGTETRSDTVRCSDPASQVKLRRPSGSKRNSGHRGADIEAGRPGPLDARHRTTAEDLAHHQAPSSAAA